MTGQFVKKASFLHFSDLHMGSVINGRPTDRNYLESLKEFGLVCRSHDIGIMRELVHITKLIGKEKVFGDQSRGETDGLFITGDISTDPISKKSYDSIYQFITSSIRLGEEEHGLSFSPNVVFSVPGNHDKLVEPTLEKYLSSGFAPQEGRRLNQYGDYITLFKVGSKGFLIYGLNSSRMIPRNIASGEITQEQIADMVSALRSVYDESSTSGMFKGGITVQSNGEITDGIEACSHSYVVRILLMHHHPHLLSKKNLKRLKKHYIYYKDIQLSIMDPRPFWKWAGDIFDVVLHGHLHIPLLYDFRELPDDYLHNKKLANRRFVIGCGTTIEWNRKRKDQSFNVIDFVEKEMPDPILNRDGFRLSTYIREKRRFSSPCFVKHVWKRYKGRTRLTPARPDEYGDFFLLKGVVERDSEALLERINMHVRTEKTM